jgi:hypothetical protein
MKVHLVSVFLDRMIPTWHLNSRIADDQSGIKVSLTIHKQIIDLLEESGTVGMTLNVRTIPLIILSK